MIDYDNDKLVVNSLNIKSTAYVYRKNNEVISSLERSNKSEQELLFKIRISFGKKKHLEIIRNKYDFDENDNLINPNPCFFILKPSKIDPKMNRYKLSPGEIVKIGRITMRIRDIKFQKNNNKNIEEKTSNNNKTIEEKNKEKEAYNKNKKMTRLETTEAKLNSNEEYSTKKTIKKKTQKDIFSKLEKMKRVCRICYLEEDENNPEDPLVQPCICTGSVKFIHLTCLRKWVSTRSCVKIDTSPDCSIFLIKPVECELCKTKFPDFIKFENRLLPVIDFSQEYDNYLTLESLTLDRQNNKFIYAISLDKERKIKIGRGHEARVLLSDISVSRIHCIMTIEKNQVFIEDNDSKFGTLILVQTPVIKVAENLPLYIQVGRTYFECKLQKPFKLFNCCEAEEKTNIFYYYNQNEKFIKENLGMVIKPDLSEIDSDEAEGDLINNTLEQKFPLDIVNKYKINSINEKIVFNGDGDKMSDNEYLLLKHNKRKKIIKKEMIYDSDEEAKKEEEKNNGENNEENEEQNNENENDNDNDNDDYDDDNNEDNITASLNDDEEGESENTNSKNNERNNNEEVNNNEVNEIMANN